MLVEKQHFTEQQAIRLDLLRNGYRPLPIRNKACYIKDWPAIRATPEIITDWTRMRKYTGTAVRALDGVVAIDMDVDDETLVTRMIAAVERAFPQLREAPIRTGSGHKVCMFARIDTEDPSEQFGTFYTALYARPGTEFFDEKGAPLRAVGHRVEVFEGSSTRLIGVYGAHSMADDGSIAISYDWVDGVGLREVPFKALPLMRRSQIRAMIDEVLTPILDDAGWPRHPGSNPGVARTDVVYDLTEDMVFNCDDGVARSLDELPDYVDDAGYGRARCSASWLPDGGGGAYVNTTRCIISLSWDRVPMILETSSYEMHKPVSSERGDRPLSQTVSLFRDKLRAADIDLSAAQSEFPVTAPGFWDVVSDLRKNWAWCAARTRSILPVFGAEDQSMAVVNARATYLPHRATFEDDKGKEKSVNPFDVWLATHGRHEVIGYRYMPGAGPGVYATPDGLAINSYRAPVLKLPADKEVVEGHWRLWEDFLAHLLPDDDERAWFARWLAHKTVHPTEPGVAVLMVAPQTYGVGRGTLADMLQDVFGEQNVREVSSRMLSGEGSQSQYTDWLVNCLFVTVPEIVADGEDGVGMAWKRRRIYERLKELLDPRARRVQVVRKGLPNYFDDTYASFLMASNHENALPLPEGDRRVAVLTNGDVPLIETGELYDRVNVVRGDLGFAASVRDWLLRQDIAGFSPQSVPATEGGVVMRDGNESEVQVYVDQVLNEWPLGWITEAVVIQRAAGLLARAGIEDEGRRTRSALLDALAARWVRSGSMKVGAAQSRIWCRDRNARKQLRETPQEALGEALAAASGSAGGSGRARLKAVGG